MELTEQVQAAIRALDAPFEVVEIDPEYADTAAFCEQYGYDPAASANAILIASKRPPGVHALCVALATTRLDVNHRVRALMGVKKLSFASPEATKDLTGMMIGGVTPFGVPDDLTIYVDSAVLEPDPIIVGGGDRSTKIILSPTVFTRMPSVEIVPDLAVS